jgi:hypothetical protein
MAAATVTYGSVVSVMLRTGFISGGNPAKTGAFRCSTPGVRTVFAANRRDRRRIGSGGASRGRSAGNIGMVTVFHPDPERLASLGYEPPVTHVPAIFESSGRYCREHNRYLRERSLAEWHPGLGSDIPRKRTLKNIADNLANFIQWCEARKKAWRTLRFADVLEYQREQMSSKWSALGERLDAGTANRRADEATNFLRWAAERGLRPSFTSRCSRANCTRSMDQS